MKKLAILTAVLVLAICPSIVCAAAKAKYNFHSSVEVLPAGTDGSAGKNATYAYFGDWPQTVKDANVTVDEENRVYVGGNTYYRGSDGAWYAKRTEAALYAQIKYSDGSSAKVAAENSSRYFKVEPIKWQLFTDDYNMTGNTLLVAENVLEGLTWFNGGNRESSGGKEILRNNYRYSKARAFLNGSYESDDSQYPLYRDRGFLQSAFTPEAQALIATTKVENTPEDMSTGIGTDINEAFACEATYDKIFLLSTGEITSAPYGFDLYKASGSGNQHLKRNATDYAIANSAQEWHMSSTGALWSLRSPYYRKDGSIDIVNAKGIVSDYETSRTGSGFLPAMTMTAASLSQEKPSPANSSANGTQSSQGKSTQSSQPQTQTQSQPQASASQLSQGVQIGGWKKNDFSPSPTGIELDFTQAIGILIPRAGTYSIVMTYTSGAHKLVSSNAAIKADGSVIASIPQEMSAGANPREIVYTFSLSKVPKSLVFSATFSTSGGSDSNGIITFRTEADGTPVTKAESGSKTTQAQNQGQKQTQAQTQTQTQTTPQTAQQSSGSKSFKNDPEILACFNKTNEFRTGKEAFYLNSDNKTTTSMVGKLGKLTLDEELCKAAQIRAEEIVKNFSHTRPDGRSCFTVLKDQNISYMAVGENIAAGSASGANTFVMWKEDGQSYSGQGHRRNMLSPNFTRIGIAYATKKGSTYGTYWVMILAK